MELKHLIKSINESVKSPYGKGGESWYDLQDAKKLAKEDGKDPDRLSYGELSDYIDKAEKARKARKDEDKQRLDPKCWKGYKKQGTKMKGGVRVNNCVPESLVHLAEQVKKGVPLCDSLFRYQSEAYFDTFIKAKQLREAGALPELDWESEEMLTTDIGESVVLKGGKRVWLDVPYLNEDWNSEIRQIIDQTGGQALARKYVDGDEDFYGTPMFDALFDYFSNNGEMPYGTMTGDDGDADQWILDQLEQDEILDEGRGLIRGGIITLAMLAGLLHMDNKMTQKAYDNSPQLQQLVLHLERAHATGDERMIDQLEDRISAHKFRLKQGYGDIRGRDGEFVPAKDIPYDRKSESDDSIRSKIGWNEELNRMRKLAGLPESSDHPHFKLDLGKSPISHLKDCPLCTGGGMDLDDVPTGMNLRGDNICPSCSGFGKLGVVDYVKNLPGFQKKDAVDFLKQNFKNSFDPKYGNRAVSDNMFEMKMVKTSIGDMPLNDDGSPLSWPDYWEWEKSTGETRKNKASLRYELYVADAKEYVGEAEYQGKDVELNKPKRGGSKKYYVYVKNPKTGNVKKISFGDVTGLRTKSGNKKRAKSFAARHNCEKKNDKMKAGYWACRLPRYGLVKGGQWW